MGWRWSPPEEDLIVLGETHIFAVIGEPSDDQVLLDHVLRDEEHCDHEQTDAVDEQAGDADDDCLSVCCEPWVEDEVLIAATHSYKGDDGEEEQ